MSTVTTAFGKAAAEGRAALVGYLPAGFPDKETAIKAALAMAEAGADVIEVGLPYSDPLMDGPVIARRRSTARCGNGTKVRDVLDTVQAIAATAAPPTLVMTVLEPGRPATAPTAFAQRPRRVPAAPGTITART